MYIGRGVRLILLFISNQKISKERKYIVLKYVLRRLVQIQSCSCRSSTFLALMKVISTIENDVD